MKNTIAPLGLLLTLLGTPACTDAGKCTRGTEDCAIVENVSPSRRCAAGLVEQDGFCVDDDGPPNGGSGGNGGSSGGSGGRSGSGGSGEPDAGPPVDCTGDDFADACVAFCEAFCNNEQALCVESVCSADDCDPGGEVFTACNEICSAEDDPAGCAQSLCLGQADYKCEDFGAVDSVTGIYVSLCFGNDPDCVGNPDYGCSDTCGTIDTDYGGVGADLAEDNLCEDGGDSSVSSACPRGTDCTDCGERACSEGGESCGGHGDCCGFYENGALCVELATGPTCLVSCTESGACDEGLRCVEVDDNRNSVCAP